MGGGSGTGTQTNDLERGGPHSTGWAKNFAKNSHGQLVPKQLKGAELAICYVFNELHNTSI